MKLSLSLLTFREDTVIWKQPIPASLHGDLIELAERCRESSPELDFEGALILGLRSAVQALRFKLNHHAKVVLAAMVVAALALTLSTGAGAASIVVNSLADPGARGICALRDAITAANTKTATNGCKAGNGYDTIRFSVTGTITLVSTLPQVTDRRLTINGPASPRITIDGDNEYPHIGVQVLQVASCATLELRNLTIAHGFSEPKGGGIINEGTLVIVDSTLADNITSGIFSTGLSGEGGAIYNDGVLTVVNSTFTGNQSIGPYEGAGEGGGIYNDGKLTVVKSIFSNNLGPADGGGIANYKILRVTESTFSDNSAYGFGGGIDNVGTLNVTNSTFSNNFANFDGGGIYNDDTLTVVNSTFSGNSGLGDGILNDGILKVTNSTFSGNSDGAIVNDDFASLKNTILASNVSSPSKNCTEFGTGTIIDAGYNISDDASCKFSATSSRNNTNPMLDPKGLQYNGGPTETIALDSESPAIDAIPVADCTDQASPPNRIITDQRGAIRPDAGEVQCDIGAYEFQDFAGQPFCESKNIFALVRRFGSLETAASVLGFPSVKALLKAIQISCGG